MVEVPSMFHWTIRSVFGFGVEDGEGSVTSDAGEAGTDGYC